MRLIVGLGNPGKKYEATRHNAGFMVLDNLIANSQQPIAPFRLAHQFESEKTQTGGLGEGQIIFAKPHTFMNNSGEAVKKILSYYKIGTDDLLVICDDIDLDFGTIRVRSEGSSGGHKGLESIITRIGDSRFIRIRIGIGSNHEKNIPSEDYVLQKFTLEEKLIIDKAIDKAVKIVLNWIETNTLKEETIRVK